jgi:hypothetical protein
MIKRLFEKVTGTPWTTTRCVTTEFGPPPGAEYAREIAEIGDWKINELVEHLEPAELRAWLADWRAEREEMHEARGWHVRERVTGLTGW